MEPSAMPAHHQPGSGRARLAAVATAAAGVLHVGAAVPHVADDLLMGAGFVIVGWVQLALAALLLTQMSRRPVVLGVITVHLASIGAWAMSRTVGLPLGHPGVDPVAMPDALTVALEVGAIGLAAWSLRRPVTRRPRRSVAIACLAAMWVFAIAGSAVGVAELGQADAGGGHGHGGEAADGHDEPAQAMDAHGDEASSGPTLETASAALHEHDGDTLHLHDARDPHVHESGIVHLHGGGEDGSDPAEDTDGHEHAPGEGH